MKTIIEPHELYLRIQNPNLVLLDASPDSNVSRIEPFLPGKCIPGAIRCDAQLFTDPTAQVPNTLISSNGFEKVAQSLGIDQDSEIVVYDNLGIYTSARVKWMFNVMGHSRVSILNGGFKSWVDADYGIGASFRAISKKGNFKAKFQKELYQTSDQVLSKLNSDQKILDARSEKRFKALAPEPREGMRSGHIPNSINLPFRQVLDDGRLKSKDALKELFNTLNPMDEEMIFSCGSGLTACIVYAAAEYAGRSKLSVYDGSWSEWSTTPSLPISK